MTTDAEDIIRAMAETAERSARSSADTFRLRIWRQIDEISKLAGIDVDIAKLKGQILEDLEKERKANKGRMKKTDYNQPPTKLRQQFERAHRNCTRQGAADEIAVRYGGQVTLPRIENLQEKHPANRTLRDNCKNRASYTVSSC